MLLLSVEAQVTTAVALSAFGESGIGARSEMGGDNRFGTYRVVPWLGARRHLITWTEVDKTVRR
jgi:hypothetical protein